MGWLIYCGKTIVITTTILKRIFFTNSRKEARTGKGWRNFSFSNDNWSDEKAIDFYEENMYILSR